MRCRANILVQQYWMNKPLATIMRALFTGGALGHYHSSVHPLPDPILHNPIRIVNLDGDRWWWEVEETLGPGDLQKMHSHVQEAWNTMKMDPVLLSGHCPMSLLRMMGRLLGTRVGWKG